MWPPYPSPQTAAWSSLGKCYAEKISIHLCFCQFPAHTIRLTYTSQESFAISLSLISVERFWHLPGGSEAMAFEIATSMSNNAHSPRISLTQGFLVPYSKISWLKNKSRPRQIHWIILQDLWRRISIKSSSNYSI